MQGEERYTDRSTDPRNAGGREIHRSTDPRKAGRREIHRQKHRS